MEKRIQQLIDRRKKSGETDSDIVQLLIVEESMSAVESMIAVGIVDPIGGIVKVNNYEVKGNKK